MDEIFHVPQYMRTWAWLWESQPWEWDPAITTFPGVYLLTAIFPVRLGVFGLRFLNAFVVNLGTFVVAQHLSGKDESSALLVLAYPLNLFYSFLYYTDSAATFFVLLTALLVQNRRFTPSGVAALIAVLVRQTNIVWVFGLCLWECIERFRKRETVWHTVYIILRDLWIHLLLGVGFFGFIIFINKGSIVVGHQEHHAFSLHFAQFNYLVLTCIGALGPWVWLRIMRNASASAPQKLKLTIILFILSVCASEFGTVAHPFILSDNRHYSFYFYRYFVSKRWIRSLIFPVVVSVSIVHADLFSRKSASSRIGLCILSTCALICIVPTPLLELRYFNIPMSLLLAQQQLQTSERRRILLFFMAVNLITVIVFVFRSYVGADGSIARFMY